MAQQNLCASGQSHWQTALIEIHCQCLVVVTVVVYCTFAEETAAGRAKENVVSGLKGLNAG